MRLGRLPIDGDDAVHRVHQRLLVGSSDAGCIRKAVDRVASPGRVDRPILAAQISQHGRTPAVHRELYRRASNGLKDNMPSKSAKSRRVRSARASVDAAHRHRRLSGRDAAGHLRVRRRCSRNWRRSSCRRRAIRCPICPASGGLVPTDVGMMIDTAPIQSVRPHQVDTLVIPGGPGIWEIRKDAALMKWISQAVAEGASRRLGMPRGVRAGLDRRARWQARGDPLALLSEAAGQLSKHSRRAERDLRQGRAGSGHRPASAPASILRLQ